MRSKDKCSMCPAIHTKSRSWLRSSSTHEPSDPPLRVVILICFATPSFYLFRHFRSRKGGRAATPYGRSYTENETTRIGASPFRGGIDRAVAAAFDEERGAATRAFYLACALTRKIPPLARWNVRDLSFCISLKRKT